MPHIDILGAGVAGLALAASLSADGSREHSVALHDQRFGAPDVGTAFVIWPWAMRALARLGVADQVRDLGVHATSATIRDARDRALGSVDGQDLWLITRPDLVRLLREAVSPAVELRRGRVDSTAALPGDLLVGADGVHSVVRREGWGSSSMPRPASVTVFRGVISQDLGVRELVEWWGRGIQAGVTPNPGGTTNWFASMPVREFADDGEALECLREAVTPLPALVRHVAALAEPGLTLVNPVITSRRITRLVRGRSVLIGDAAHAMTPNLGRGACEAIADAVVLGDLLRSHHPVEAAQRYQRRRLLAPQAFAAVAGTVMRLSLARHATGVRDSLVRLAS